MPASAAPVGGGCSVISPVQTVSTGWSVRRHVNVRTGLDAITSAETAPAPQGGLERGAVSRVLRDSGVNGVTR